MAKTDNEDILSKKIKELKNKLLSDSKAPRAQRPLLDTSTPLRIFFELIAGLIVGGLLGYWVDKYFDLNPLFIIIFTIFGILGALYNIYKEVQK